MHWLGVVTQLAAGAKGMMPPFSPLTGIVNINTQATADSVFQAAATGVERLTANGHFAHYAAVGYN